MAPVTHQAVREFLRELEEHFSEDRPGNKAVYWTSPPTHERTMSITCET